MDRIQKDKGIKKDILGENDERSKVTGQIEHGWSKIQ